MIEMKILIEKLWTSTIYEQLRPKNKNTITASQKLLIIPNSNTLIPRIKFLDLFGSALFSIFGHFSPHSDHNLT